MPTLEWIGKDKIINHHQEVPFKILERKYSFNENGQTGTDNKSDFLYIQGAKDCIILLKTLGVIA